MTGIQMFFFFCLWEPEKVNSQKKIPKQFHFRENEYKSIFSEFWENTFATITY